MNISYITQTFMANKIKKFYYLGYKMIINNCIYNPLIGETLPSNEFIIEKTQVDNQDIYFYNYILDLVEYNELDINSYSIVDNNAQLLTVGQLLHLIEKYKVVETCNMPIG